MVDALKRTLKIPNKFVPYMETHQIYELFHELTNRLVVEQPKDHINFIRNRLQEIRISRNTPRIVILAPPFFDTARLASLMYKSIGCLWITFAAVLNEDCLDESNYLSGKYLETELVQGVQHILKRNVRSLQGWLMTDIPRTRGEALALQRMGILPTHTFQLVRSSDNVPFLTINESSRRLSELRHVYQSTLMEVEIGDRSIEELAEICCGLVQNKAPCKAAILPRVLIIGARGSGRQTQARHLCCRFNLVHVNFDTVMARARQENNKTAQKIRWYETTTKPTPPTLLASLIEKALLAKDCLDQGWVLTGFPRNVSEFKALDLLSTPPNRIIFLDVKPTTCLERITTRHINKFTGTTRNLQGDTLMEKRYRNYVSHPHDEGEVVKTEIVDFMVALPKMLEYAAGTAARIDGNSALRAVCERSEAVVIRPPPFVEPRDPFTPSRLNLAVDQDVDEHSEMTSGAGDGDEATAPNVASGPTAGSDEDNLRGYLDEFTELVLLVEATLDEVLRRTVVIGKKPTKKYDERVHECLTIIRATPHSLDKGFSEWAAERDRLRREKEREDELLAGMTSEERLRYNKMTAEEKQRFRDAAYSNADNADNANDGEDGDGNADGTNSAARMERQVSSHLKKLASDVASDVFSNKENTLLAITAGIVKEVNRLTKDMLPNEKYASADDGCHCFLIGTVRHDTIEECQDNLSPTENMLRRITSAIVEHLVQEAASAIVPINDNNAMNVINTAIVNQLVNKVMNEMIPSVRKTTSFINIAITEFLENENAIVETMPLEERKLINITSAIVKKLVNKETKIKSSTEKIPSSSPANNAKTPFHPSENTYSTFPATTKDSQSHADVNEEVELSTFNMTTAESLKTFVKPSVSPHTIGVTSADHSLSHEPKAHEVSEHAIMEASTLKEIRHSEAVDNEHEQDDEMEKFLMDQPPYMIQMATFPKVSARPTLETVFEETEEDEPY